MFLTGQKERHPERVRDALLARCRLERIEPPAEGRIDRLVRSALRTGEETLSSRVADRVSEESKIRIAALLAVDDVEAAAGADVEGADATDY